METSVKQSHVRKSESEIRALLRKKAKSKISVQEFCKIHQIHKATFYNWRHKYGPESEKQQKFIPVQISDIASEATLFAEIELPGKVMVRFFEKVDPSY